MGEAIPSMWTEPLVEVTEEDLLVETGERAGFASETEGEMTVVLNTNLTDELIAEGYVRELVSKIQTMRKEAGFEVTDHIRLFISADETLMKVVAENKEKMLKEVLADELAAVKPKGFEKSWDINGVAADVVVEKL